MPFLRLLVEILLNHCYTGAFGRSFARLIALAAPSVVGAQHLQILPRQLARYGRGIAGSVGLVNGLVIDGEGSEQLVRALLLHPLHLISLSWVID